MTYDDTQICISYLLHRFTKTHPVNLGGNCHWILGNTCVSYDLQEILVFPE